MMTPPESAYPCTAYHLSGKRPFQRRNRSLAVPGHPPTCSRTTTYDIKRTNARAPSQIRRHPVLHYNPSTSQAAVDTAPREEGADATVLQNIKRMAPDAPPDDMPNSSNLPTPPPLDI